MFAWEEDDAPPVQPPRPADVSNALVWLRVLLGLLVISWLSIGCWQVVLYSGDLVSGAGDRVLDFSPSDTPHAWTGRVDAQRHAQTLMLLALLPAAGALVALAARQRVAAALLGIGAVLGLLIGAGLYAAVTPDDREPQYCQGWGGADHPCPGA